MKINFDDLFASLDIMWKGMVGLFVICIFIMLLTMLISRIVMPKDKQE
ncbi:MAG: hypothetical protein LBI28_14120 [Treponema sp.]|jgi:hypothetical protein|nr:hypothetical protein [Treponema sp.]